MDEHTRLCIVELGRKMPEGASFCPYCGVSLAYTPPEPRTESRWGVYLTNGSSVSEQIPVEHETAEGAVAALLLRTKDITYSPMPHFVALIAPDQRIEQWRPLTFDAAAGTATIGDPVTPDNEFLDVSYLESKPA